MVAESDDELPSEDQNVKEGKCERKPGGRSKIDTKTPKCRKPSAGTGKIGVDEGASSEAGEKVTAITKSEDDKGKKEEEKEGAKEKEQEEDAPFILAKPADGRWRPRKIVFKVPPERKSIYKDIHVQNPTNEQKTFKLKCTSTEFFRVQPPLGLVNPMETAKIRLWYENNDGDVPKDGKKHYFAVYFKKSEEGKAVKELWQKKGKYEGICRINAVFEKIEGSSKDIKSKSPKGIDNADKPKAA